jgi:predicted transport protein
MKAMALFKNNNGKLQEIEEKKIDLEKDIQKLSEENLELIFGLQFIHTEFEHNGLRLDTVAFDHSNNAFVVIEYKRDRSFSVVDQGYAYLALLLNNKAEFILLYNEKTGKTLTKAQVDWSQSRVIFVAQGFTVHQQQAINFRDMPIELWQVKMYKNDTALYSQLKPKSATESVKTITKDSKVQSVINEIKVYSVEDHFKGSRVATQSLYESLKDKLMTLGSSVSENPRATYIGFSLKENGGDTIAYVRPQSESIKLDIPRIRPEDINDPLKMLTYKVNSFETKNTPVSVAYAKNEADLDYLIGILRQVIELKFK